MRILFGIALTLVLSLSACGNGGAGNVRRRAQEAIDSHEMSEGRAKPTSQQSVQQEEERSQTQQSAQEYRPKADKKPAPMKTPAPLGPENAGHFTTPGPQKRLATLFEESYKEMKDEDAQFLDGFLEKNGETIVKNLPPEKKEVLASIIIAGLSKVNIFEIKLAICLTEEATKHTEYKDQKERFRKITEYCRGKVKPQAGYTPIKEAASKNDPKLTKLINSYLEKSTSDTKSLLSINNVINLAAKVNLAESFASPQPLKETSGEKTLEAAENFGLFPEDSVDLYAALSEALRVEFEKEDASNIPKDMQNFIRNYIAECLKRDPASPRVAMPCDPDPESI